jgi:hypothetical protein
MLNGNGRINEGEIHISLSLADGRTKSYTLRPTMRAASLISTQLKGFAGARNAVVSEDFDAVGFIIVVGANLKDKEARQLPNEVWENGLTRELLFPLMEYLAILNNGGRPLSPDEAAVYRSIDGTTDNVQIEHYHPDTHEGNE